MTIRGASELVEHLRQRGAVLSAGPAGVAYRAPRGVVTEAIRSELLARKAELAELLLAEADFHRLFDRVEELRAAAAANERYAIADWAEKQRRELQELESGPLLAALNRLLDLCDPVADAGEKPAPVAGLE